MSHSHPRSSDFNPADKPVILYLLVVVGLLLRLIVLIFAENRLDTDEATVGIMALNILEGKDFPFFFYGTEYNGGGAIEAYIGALIFKFFGPSEISLKFSPLILWTVTSLLFADLCRRTLSGTRAFAAVLFFCISTSFFLEWSLKARGGFAETVLFSVLLIWLAEPPQFLKKKRNFQCLSFGIACGIGIYASEMLLAMVGCAGIWLIIRCDKGERIHALRMLLLGGFIGFLPLIIYNLTHDFSNIKSSVVYGFFVRRGESSGPLSLYQLWLSAKFIFGKTYVLIIPGILIVFVQLIRKIKNLEIGHVFLMHIVVYILAYWMSGLRYLDVPPSRVLYALYPGLAVLLAYAIDVRRNATLTKQVLSAGVVVLWLAMVSLPLTQWISSGVPREASSWRGSWALTDGNGLYKKLVDLGAEEVYSNGWTRRSLMFAMQKAIYLDPGNPSLGIFFMIPPSPESPDKQVHKHVAFVLNSGGSMIEKIEKVLQSNGIPYERSEFKQLVILWRLDSSSIHQEIGLPSAISRADWNPMPLTPDGFN